MMGSSSSSFVSSSRSSGSSSSRAAPNGAVWKWRSDNVEWIPYDDSTSRAIESAFSKGESSVEFSLDGGHHPSHFIIFMFQPFFQYNVKTKRQRTVRRHVTGQGSIPTWQWLEDEINHWHVYDRQLSSVFEAAWQQSATCQTGNSPAGVSFMIKNQQYSLIFDTDGVQYNLNSLALRSVRRVPPTNVASQAQNSSGQLQQESSCNIDNSLINYCASPSENEECSICLDTLQNNSVELMNCHHFFHKHCILEWFQSRPSCPQCFAVYGVITGTQPPGHMSIQCIPCSKHFFLQGYKGVDVIQITYIFPNGTQTQEHPSPGALYAGTRRTAYLPNNNEGKEVLELLKTAWKRRLIFTVGTSVTSGVSDTVVWAGIHHKTKMSGGSTNHGYPDEGYFDRVKNELASLNVR